MPFNYLLCYDRTASTTTSHTNKVSGLFLQAVFFFFLLHFIKRTHIINYQEAKIKKSTDYISGSLSLLCLNFGFQQADTELLHIGIILAFDILASLSFPLLRCWVYFVCFLYRVVYCKSTPGFDWQQIGSSHVNHHLVPTSSFSYHYAVVHTSLLTYMIGLLTLQLVVAFSLLKSSYPHRFTNMLLSSFSVFFVWIYIFMHN